MKKKKKATQYKAVDGKFVPEHMQELTIPDAAIYYVVNRFLQGKNKEGGPIVVGISTNTVKDVLGLFIDWAAHNGYVKDGIMTVGGHKVD